MPILLNKLVSRPAISLLWGAVLGLVMTTSAAIAGPRGGAVVGGSATITAPNANTVNIHQSTDRAIINWQSFNIDRGETTQFFQPSTRSVTLNRVTGSQDPSRIMGNLRANGTVIISNPDGILFGRNSRIDVGGLIATTSDIRNNDFMAGRLNFTIPGNPAASIVNQGTISIADYGVGALVAPGVRNEGVIAGRFSKINITAANGFTLDLYGDGLINLMVNDEIAREVIDVATGRPMSDLVKNEGRITANGGVVALRSATARRAVNSVVNNTGYIEARSIGRRGGKIVLGGQTKRTKKRNSPTQRVRVSGRINASGNSRGEKGGSVRILGEEIIMAGVAITATGDAGGGRVLIGGDYLGGNGDPVTIARYNIQLEPDAVPTAERVHLSATTSINADATRNGNGGKIIVWSDGITLASATLTARGGQSGGDGGFIETSGKQTLNVDNIYVDTSSKAGNYGHWLLDPMNIYVDRTYASTIGSNLKWTNVTLTASQAIYIQSDIFKNGGRDTDFSVYAPFIYQLQGTSVVSTNASLNVRYQASDRIWFGRGFNGATAKIYSNNGNINLIAPHFIGVNGTLDAGYGQILLEARSPRLVEIDSGITFVAGTTLRGSDVNIISPVITGRSGVRVIKTYRPVVVGQAEDGSFIQFTDVFGLASDYGRLRAKIRKNQLLALANVVDKTKKAVTLTVKKFVGAGKKVIISGVALSKKTAAFVKQQAARAAQASKRAVNKVGNVSGGWLFDWTTKGYKTKSVNNSLDNPDKFNPGVGGFNKDAHKIAAFLSTASYNDPGIVASGVLGKQEVEAITTNLLYENGLVPGPASGSLNENSVASSFLRKGPSGGEFLLARKGSTYFLSIEGSEEGISDWISTNLNVGLGEMHNGFKARAQDILAGIPPAVLGQLAKGKAKIQISGHSLGGASAIILTSLMEERGYINSNNAAVYTFGSAKPGGVQFANKMEATGIFISNTKRSGDPVPKLGAKFVFGSVPGVTNIVANRPNDAGLVSRAIKIALPKSSKVRSLIYQHSINLIYQHSIKGYFEDALAK